MRKLYLLLLMTGALCSVQAQNVGIGTTSPSPNAILHLENGVQNLGLLLPNLDHTTFTPLASDTGLLVYDNVLNNIFYWDGTAWQTPGGGSFWDLNGNAGTVDGVDFIGTTDNVALGIRVNNLISGRIDPAGPTFFGYQAGEVNTSTNSTGFGYWALRSNTTGSENVAVGIAALFSNTTGFGNSGIGAYALQVNLNGAWNTAAGNYALGNNIGGNFNSAFGRNSMVGNTSGSSNSALGYQSLITNTTGTDNTAIGANADVASLALTNATAIGANAIVGASNSLILGNNANVGIGTSTPSSKLEVVGEALINSLTVGRGSGNDISNTAFGNQALAANLAAGLANTAIGQSALSSNTTGTSSTALGFYALRLNTTGYSNVAVGHGALDNNSIGFENTAVGQGALQANTTGQRNTSIGRGTLTNNTTGSYNIAMGWEALVGHLSGNYNTAIGNDVLRNNASGSNNTGVGSFAVQGTTGSNNTGFGNSALRNNTTGTDNTAIGFSADVASGALTNATAIGANAIVGASNSLILGNNANVGIGTSTPANKLEVIGDAAKFDSVIIANNAQVGYVLTAADATGAASWQPAPGGGSLQSAYDGGQTVNMSGGNINLISSAANSVLYVDELNERIGIGTVNPLNNLHVNSLNTQSTIRLTNSTTASLGLWLQSDNLQSYILNYENTPLKFGTNGADRMTISATGNVGIGNNSPNAPLQFATALANRKIVLFEGANNDHQYFGFGVNGAALRYQVNGTFASHIFYASVNTTTSNELMRIVGDGNVGIGVSAPTERLQISSSAVSTSMIITNDAIGLTNTDGLLIGENNAGVAIINNRENERLLIGTNGNIGQMLLDQSGNVGIGQPTPLHRLDVLGAIRSGGNGLDGQMRIFSEQGATDYEVIFNPNPTMTATTTYTLPADDGAASEVLTTDGSGGLSWGSASGIVADNGLTLTGTDLDLGGAMNQNTTIDRNDYGFALGTNNTITGPQNAELIFGYDNTISGFGGIAIGTGNTVGGNRGTALGNYVEANHLGSFLIGDWSGSGPELTASSTSDQFTARFNSGYRFYATSNPISNPNTGMFINNAGFVGIGTNNPGNNQLSVITQSTNGSAGYFENNIASGINGSALRVLNSGTRSIGHNGALIQNLVTKVGGSNSTKTGLRIESTGAWGVATVNQPNIGLDVTVSGADNNYAAIFNGGNVGIGTSNPTNNLEINGTLRSTGKSQINGTYFITTASTSLPVDNEIPIISGAMANVVFYTACASPTFAAVLYISPAGLVEIMSEAGNGGNNVSGSGTNTLTLNDACGQNIDYVFTVVGGIATISYPTGPFTTAKWVVTPI